MCSNIISATILLTVVLQASSERTFHFLSKEKEVITDQWVALQRLGGFVSV